MAENEPTHRIVHQSPIIVTTYAYMIVRLVEYGDGTFGFSWRKSPFETWWNSERRFKSKSEVESAVRRFIDKTTEREPYLQISAEGLDVGTR